MAPQVLLGLVHAHKQQAHQMFTNAVAGSCYANALFGGK